MKIPKKCHHKATGQAYARVGGRCRYLGRWGSPEAEENYRRLVAELLALPGAAPVPQSVATVKEAADAYLVHAASRYAHPDGTETGQMDRVRRALAVLTGLYGTLLLAKIGAGHLDACRAEMGRLKWSRTTAASAAGCIRRMWAWLVSRGHAHPDALARMKALEPLREGQYGLRESPPVLDVPEADYLAVVARLARTNPVVAAVCRVQHATGMRTGEVCGMDWAGVTGWGGELPVYRPSRHKQSHKGQGRAVVLFPEAVAAMGARRESGPVFRPADAVAHARRVSGAMPPGWRSRVENRAPLTSPGESYTPNTYGQCVRRACLAAGVTPWHPYRLRHTAATRFQRDYGRDAAAQLLGHAKGSRVTERYLHGDAVAALVEMLKKRAAG